MDEAPKTIWLQWSEPDEVTWCQDKMHDDDVEYLRIDKCTWTKRVTVNTGDRWVTGCEHDYLLAFDETPQDEDFEYCPFCGKPIQEADQ